MTQTQFGRFEDDLRKTFPASASKAANGSRKEAIFMHCKSCAGSAQEAKKCNATFCFLHPYRPGAK